MQDRLSFRSIYADGKTVIRHGWMSLIAAQVFFKLAALLIFVPLAVATLNALLGKRVSVGNAALMQFALSISGAITIVLLPSLILAAVFIEQAFMIRLTNDAFARARPGLGAAAAKVVARAPQFALLAIAQIATAVAILLPFIGAGALTRWLLLSDADINYYLATRPPAFKAAAGIGVVLALGAAALLLRLYVRAFLSAPLCLLEDLRPMDAWRRSAELSRGRHGRVIWALAAWLIIRIAATAVILFLLHGLDRFVLARLGHTVAATMWSVGALLVINAIMLAVAAMVDRLAFALLTILLFRDLTGASAQPAAPPPTDEPTASRLPGLIVCGVVLIVLAVSALQTFFMVEQFTQHRRISITAHRAGAAHAPENSLAALRLAIDAGAQAAEIDVQRSSDGAIMVVHDQDLRRIAGVPLVISRSTEAQLRAADIGKMHDAKFTGEHLATLQEFMDVAQDQIHLSIELKYYGSGDPQLARAIVSAIEANDFIDQCNVISLDYPALQEVRRLNPRIRIGFLVSASIGDLTKLDVDFLSVSMNHLTPRLRSQADARGLSVAVWTVNTRQDMIRMLACGADDLVTDDPALAAETVAWYQNLSDVELVLLRVRQWLGT